LRATDVEVDVLSSKVMSFIRKNLWECTLPIEDASVLMEEMYYGMHDGILVYTWADEMCMWCHDEEFGSRNDKPTDD
jgi:hypothetical protein